MVIVSSLRIGLFPFQMGFPWLVNGADPNHLLNGMILEVHILEDEGLEPTAMGHHPIEKTLLFIYFT